MKYRKLRIAWSVAWGVVAVLLVVLWVRSYWWMDELAHRQATGLTEISTLRGEIEFYWTPNLTSMNEYWDFYSVGVLPETYSGEYVFGFDLSTVANSLSVSFPCWFLVVLSAVLATIPWIRHLRWRFSLRTLLIATTLVAVGLGLIVWVL